MVVRFVSSFDFRSEIRLIPVDLEAYLYQEVYITHLDLLPCCWSRSTREETSRIRISGLDLLYEATCAMMLCRATRAGFLRSASSLAIRTLRCASSGTTVSWTRPDGTKVPGVAFGKPRQPVVIVVQEWWGVDEAVKVRHNLLRV